jgi:hypothetical protein
MEDTGESSKLDRISGAFLLVNFEARQIFLENYTRCFRDTDQKAMYLNFSVDSLCVKSILEGLQNMATTYAGVMNRFKWIEVEALDSDRDVDESRFHWSSMNLQAFSACKLIIIRSTRDTPSSWSNNNHDRIMYTFNHLRKALLRSPGPRLGAVFIESLPGVYFEAQRLLKHLDKKLEAESVPERLYLKAESLLEHLTLEVESLPENLYLEAESDMEQGSFGTFKSTNPLGNFHVDWIVQKRTWKEIEKEYALSQGVSFFRKGNFW